MTWDNTDGMDHPDLELPLPPLRQRATALIKDEFRKLNISDAETDEAIESIRLLVWRYHQRQCLTPDPER